MALGGPWSSRTPSSMIDSIPTAIGRAGTPPVTLFTGEKCGSSVATRTRGITRTTFGIPRMGKNWNHVNKGRDVPWGPRVLHYTLAFDDKIWVMGGQTIPQIAPEEEVFYRDVWHTTDGVHWVRVQPDEPYWSARGMIGGNVVFKGRMWILGGGTYDTPQTPFRHYYGDIWSSADGVHWALENEAPPWKPRQYHEVAVFDNRMWVMEGSAEPGVSGKDCLVFRRRRQLVRAAGYSLDTPPCRQRFRPRQRPMDCRRQRQGQDGQRSLEGRQQGIAVPLTLHLQ